MARATRATRRRRELRAATKTAEVLAGGAGRAVEHDLVFAVVVYVDEEREPPECTRDREDPAFLASQLRRVQVGQPCPAVASGSAR